jgi:hypothetical protein
MTRRSISNYACFVVLQTDLNNTDGSFIAVLVKKFAGCRDVASEFQVLCRPYKSGSAIISFI